MIQAKFGLNWPSGFRGEAFWKSLQTDDGRRTPDDGPQVMAIAHMTLWVRWAKNQSLIIILFYKISDNDLNEHKKIQVEHLKKN